VSFTTNGPSPSGPPPTNTGSIAKDFNGDGHADLILQNTAAGERVIWFLVNGVYSSTTNLPTVSPDWHIAGVGDFLGNGQSDIVWEKVTGGHAIWILNNSVFNTRSTFRTSQPHGISPELQISMATVKRISFGNILPALE
jgi:hypothetical protein